MRGYGMSMACNYYLCEVYYGIIFMVKFDGYLWFFFFT
jgi:hypothetical protein